ncbi:hypothetical protein [Longimicrobium sp.]|uniref:hypothetical protein n=1 Tax=Longimicrobium sp. TaxID=2029185 RepID=UPI002BC011C6|nr:hypothetical protein [Longimicrobium sp.]HSU17878.1 hypothetical protein [Longimicrobium sp.]
MRTRPILALALTALLAGGCGSRGGDSRRAGDDQGGGDRKTAAADTTALAQDDTADFDEDDASDTHHRWQVKTTLAAEADPAHGARVPLGDLLALPDAPGVGKSDGRYQTARIPEPIGRAGMREGQIVTTRGWLHLVAHPADDDYHLQLTTSRADGNHCLIVEIPDPQKVGDARLRPLVEAARQWVRDHALAGDRPKKKGTELDTPIYVTVTGALFYDDAHVGEPPRGKRGQLAATLWEIHPVTSITAATP